MSKIIIEIEENEKGVDVLWTGNITVRYILHMIKENGGFDKLKNDLCHQLLELQMGLVEEEKDPEQYKVIHMVEEIIKDLEKKS